MGSRRTLRRLAGSLPLVLALTIALPGLALEWSEPPVGGGGPGLRYDAGSAYDPSNDRLIVFSGEDFTPLPRPNDVWVLDAATSPAPSWMQLFPTGGPPLGRGGGTTVYDPVANRLIVHGGCVGNCSPALSDTWILSNANGSGGAPHWTQVASAPIGRAFHGAAFDPVSSRMIVFGGNTAFPGTDRNDVWVFDVSGNSWSQLTPTGGPPPAREFVTMAYDEGTNRLIVFAGFVFPSSTNPATWVWLNDVWILIGANGLAGTPQWVPLPTSGEVPPPMFSPAVQYDAATDRLIVFGGFTETGTSNRLWVLEHANGVGGPPVWTELMPAGGPPDTRFGHSAAYSPATNRMVVALGRGGADEVTLFADVWVVDDANGLQTGNHYLTYQVRPSRGSPVFVPTVVSFTDQFGSADHLLTRPIELGLPADKGGEGIYDESHHVMVYAVDAAGGSLPGAAVTVRNQWGEWQVVPTRADFVLVPALRAATVGAEPSGDHYLCRRVQILAGPQSRRTVTIDDRLPEPARSYEVRNLTHLCAPAEKSHGGEVSPVGEADLHYACYGVRRARGEPRHDPVFGIEVRDQFGDWRVNSRVEARFCVPAFKEVGG